MSRFLKLTLVAGLTISATATMLRAGEYDLGRPALPEEIAAWDVNIMPDGRGLPEGSGDVWTGEEVFIENCAFCHGDFAEGAGNWPALAGGDGTLADEDPVKTTGSYWPYLSTVWDYVNRSMPYGNAQSLSPDDVYAITAYILYSNFLVDDDFVLSKENFADVEMPNADGFIVDNRAETEYAIWRGEPCMENCKDAVEITMRAAVLDVTPVEEKPGEAEEASAPAPEEQPVETAAAAPDPEPAAATPDPELVATGEKVFRQCKACHMVGEGAKNRVGPPLNGVVERPAGAVDGFSYSSAMESMAADGLVWDDESLAAFLADPRGYVKGTSMGFAGLRSDEEIEAVTAYLSSFGE